MVVLTPLHISYFLSLVRSRVIFEAAMNCQIALSFTDEILLKKSWFTLCAIQGSTTHYYFSPTIISHDDKTDPPPIKSKHRTMTRAESERRESVMPPESEEELEPPPKHRRSMPIIRM